MSPRRAYARTMELMTNKQVEDGRSRPVPVHLIIVENVRQGDPKQFRVIDITGDRLVSLLERKREKRHFEVPLPVAVYDALTLPVAQP